MDVVGSLVRRAKRRAAQWAYRLAVCNQDMVDGRFWAIMGKDITRHAGHPIPCKAYDWFYHPLMQIYRRWNFV